MDQWLKAIFEKIDNVSKIEYTGRNQVKLAFAIVCNNSLPDVYLVVSLEMFSKREIVTESRVS